MEWNQPPHQPGASRVFVSAWRRVPLYNKQTQTRCANSQSILCRNQRGATWVGGASSWDGVGV